MEPSYKLTKHPIGSLKEIWTISWPLMLGLLSGSFMLFADRLLLARYSTSALNASATSGIAAYALMIIPLITAGISEVFVGRCHGADRMKEIGKPVWQMIWMSFLTVPLFWMAASWLPEMIFKGTGNEILESIYFKWLTYFAPAFCSTVALMGFFIGIGQVRMVTICTILGNLINIGLDVLFIFGYGPIPEMGIKGAALATGLSQAFQTCFLMALFLRRPYRDKYGTGSCGFHFEWFKESMQIGFPAGLGRFLEMLAHFIFFRIVTMSGQDNLTIMTVVQSFYLLLTFITEGLSKGVSAVTANLIGGKQYHLIKKVIGSTIRLHIIFSFVLNAILFLFSVPLLSSFFSESDQILLQNPAFLHTAQAALFWMGVFFLFDGFAWAYAGLLTAGGDTKFLLYASFILNWIFYILPAYVVLDVYGGTAGQGWMIISAYALLTFLTYLWRCRSGAWLSHSPEEQSLNYNV